MCIIYDHMSIMFIFFWFCCFLCIESRQLKNNKNTNFGLFLSGFVIILFIRRHSHDFYVIWIDSLVHKLFFFVLFGRQIDFCWINHTHKYTHLRCIIIFFKWISMWCRNSCTMMIKNFVKDSVAVVVIWFWFNQCVSTIISVHVITLWKKQFVFATIDSVSF